jgi:hypothetical protein
MINIRGQKKMSVLSERSRTAANPICYVDRRARRGSPREL